jgi:ADP-heptose:LPS heptosyltransferase
MKRILFLKFGALGDVLMTTPLLRQTRKSFPQAEIHYCVAEPFAVAVGRNAHLDNLITFTPNIFTAKKIVEFLKLANCLRSKKYDLIFVLDKHPAFAVLAFLAGARQRIGFNRDRMARFFLTESVQYGALRHDIHCNLDLLEKVVVPDYTDTKLDFFQMVTRQEILTRFPQLREPYFVCANSGGSNIREATAIRRLPAPLFVNFLAVLAAGRLTVLLGDGGDRKYYSSLPLPENVLNLAGATSIAECATIIAHAEKFFTTDCGLMHLAATTETPIYAFFGPTHPQRKAPLRKNVEWLWPDESIYNAEYDKCGRVPSQSYFRGLSLTDLLDKRVDSTCAAVCCLSRFR